MSDLFPIDIFRELSWLSFSNLDQVKRLPLNEQARQYNMYMYKLCKARDEYWECMQRGGKSDNPFTEYIPVASGFLQQEDLYYILQEDGSKIIITS